MDRTSLFFVLTDLSLGLVIIAISLLLLMPRGFRALEKWKDTGKTRSFSEAFFYFFLSFSLLTYICIDLVSKTLQGVSLIGGALPFEYGKFVVWLVGALLLIYLFIPNALSFFQKWRSSKKNSQFAVFSLFAFLSVYGMATLYFLYLPSLVEWKL
jgi:hypothetical protein